jgi:lysyl-tRNA synthetase class 2
MSLEDFRAEETAKIEKLRSLGVNPYPYAFGRTHRIAEVLGHFDALKEAEETVAIAGRLMALRRHGKAMFGDIADEHERIQIYIRKDGVPETDWEVSTLLSPGDIVGVHGVAFVTRTEEPTVKASQLTLLSKCLRPLPDKWHGVKDRELAQRQRYLQLAVDPEVRERFRKRAQIIKAIRDLFDAKGYLEVETPILQWIYGGAFAQPFTTHFNALDLDMYLRIADELFLKRLLVGGYDGVYEFGKDFRNEGLSVMHNPEFTMLEVYCAYLDYRDMMDLTEEIFEAVRTRLGMDKTLTWFGHEIDMTTPWPRVSMGDLIQKHAGVDILTATDEELQAAVKKAYRDSGTEEPSKGQLAKQGRAQFLDDLFSLCVEPHLIQPTFVTDFPRILSPLAKVHRSEPALTERFELFIGTKELANSFSELNDPLDQRARFEEQMALREKGVEEVQVLDEDYLRAMEYGMPPSGGLGIGIDRVAMLFTGASSIRDVLLFPHLRPESTTME